MRATKLFAGIAVMIPIFYLIFFLLMFMFFRGIFPFKIIAIIHCVIIFWTVILLGGSVCHIFCNNNIDRKDKLIWVIVMILGNIFIFPFYYYMFIFKIKNKAPLNPPRGDLNIGMTGRYK